MLAVLRPAADFLPAHWAYALADLCGKLNALTPFYGKEIVESIGIVFDKDHQEASLISRELLSRPFRDYVVLRRILRNREDFRKWDVVEINGSLVQRLRETRAPFILATGHFARWAAVPLFLERVIPHRFTVIAAPIIKNRSLNPKALWLRHHLGQMTTYMKHVRPDTAFVNPGQSGLMKELARCLTRPGNVLFTSLDAPWGGRPRGSFIRPFASKQGRRFATGGVRLARMTQTPLVLCIPYLRAANQVVIEWIRVIDPPDPNDNEADIRITSALLDDIELAIAKRPSQYVIDFLGTRKWDSYSQRWE